MKKYLMFTFFLLPLGSYSQSSLKYRVIQLNYDVQSYLHFPLEWAKGTTKYIYDGNGKLISIKTFDKYDLMNVQKFDFARSSGKLIIKHTNGVTGFLILDEQGRVIEASYFSALGENNETFPYIYKFKYSADGYLTRITSYYYDFFAHDPQPQKLHSIYQLNYEGGDLITMKTEYVDNTIFPLDYEFTYSDSLATPNWNPTIGFYINSQTDKYPLYAVPNNLFGKQSKNLLKSINTSSRNPKSYNINYSFDSDGLVSQMIISHDGVNSTFNLTYNKSN